MNGKTTCVEAVHYFLQQVQGNQRLNAWIETYNDEVLALAAKLDIERQYQGLKGKLHGVVVGLKDVISYKDHQVSASSRMLQNFTAVYSATVVERLVAEGALILGRQNCDEFAMGSSNENSFYGNVLNAVDHTKVSGGSSGGSAVAVQSRQCMISLGSDTGGSVRQPADFCGVVGFKPAYGTVSRHGLIAYASSFDQIGILGKSVDDVEQVLAVIEGPDRYDSTVHSNQKKNLLQSDISANNSLSFAYFKQALEHPSLDQEIRTSFLDFTKKLTDEGFDVQSIDFKLFKYVVPTYYILTTAEASSNLARYDGIRYGYAGSLETMDLITFYTANRSKGFGKSVKQRIMMGNFVLSTGYYDAYFTKAQQVRRKIKEHSEAVLKKFDYILSPTVPSPAFGIGEKVQDPVAMFLADIYTVYANLVGIPAISIPLFKHSNNMPYGLQLMSSSENELSLLHFSKDLMHGKKY